MCAAHVAGFDIPAAVLHALAARDHVDVWDLSTPPAAPGLFHPIALPSWLVFGALGNGDEIGLFWPEEGAAGPIVLSSSHDVYGFVPEASSVDRWLLFDTAEAPEERLAVDPDSPFHRTVAGHAALEAGDLAAAEVHYAAALAVLPSYGAARSGRARVRRRTQRPDEAAADLLEVILGPIQLDGRSFWESVRADDAQNVARTQLLRMRPGPLSDVHALVWRALPDLDFRSHPSEVPDWRPLDRLCRDLFAAGHGRAALRVHQSLVPIRLSAEARFDVCAHLEEQAAMYRAIGDAPRATYVEAVLATSR